MRLSVLLFAAAVLILWAASHLAERGVETGMALSRGGASPGTLPADAEPQDLDALKDALRAGTPSFADALEDAKDETVATEAPPRPHAPFEDAPVRPLPRNIFVTLSAPLTHRTWIKGVSAVQTTRRGELRVEAWPTDEEGRRWAFGSPELLAGESAHFRVEASALGRPLRGSFNVSSVSPSGDIRLDEPVQLTYATKAMK